MKKGKLFLSLIMLILITIVLSSLASACDDIKEIYYKYILGFDSTEPLPVENFYDPGEGPPEDEDVPGIKLKLPNGLSITDENGNKVEEILPPLKDPPIPAPKDSGTIGPGTNTASLSVGHDQNIDFSQIISSASQPPDGSIPVVYMPQKAPDIPQQDDKDLIADAEPPPDSPIKQPGDSSPIGKKPADEPKDSPDTTDEQPSYGEQEQPSHEHDIFTYYEPDIISNDANTESITITVNIATNEVYGNHYFEGYIGGGYRTATYEFSTFLDSSDSFSATSTATIYEDGQDIGEGTLRITGELSDDMSFIAGDIIDEAVGYGVMYYAYLTSQSDEQPSYEDY